MLAGVALGAMLAHLVQLNQQSWWLLIVWSVPLALPAVLDVIAQGFSSYRSNAIRRSITGILLGLGIVCLGTAVRIKIAALSPETFELVVSCHSL
jgi:hypothetical protein